MRVWKPASQVEELLGEGPDTVTQQRRGAVELPGVARAPSPSIPAPSAGPRNMIDIAALRAQQKRVGSTTMLGVGHAEPPPSGPVDVRIPAAPKVPDVASGALSAASAKTVSSRRPGTTNIDGLWSEGAARRDDDEQTVTRLRPGEDDPGGDDPTGHDQRVPAAPAEVSGKGRVRTVPYTGGAPRGGPRARAEIKPRKRALPTARSRPPPAPRRSLGRQPAAKHKPKRGLPRRRPSKAPPPIASDAVLSDALPARGSGDQGPTREAQPGSALDDLRGAGEAQRFVVERALQAQAGVVDRSAPGADEAGPRATPRDDAGPADRGAARSTDVAVGASSPGAGSAGTAGAPAGVASPAPPAQPAVPPNAGLSPPPEAPPPGLAATQSQPAPSSQVFSVRHGVPILFGVRLTMPLLGGVSGAVLALVVVAFVVGRCSAPAQSGLASGVEARVGWAAVPLFARARAGSFAPPRPCLMMRAPSRWAWAASHRIPIEMGITPAGKLAIGYARSTELPRGMLVDPTTGKAEDVFKPEDELDSSLSRVVPLQADGELTFGATLGEDGNVTGSVFAPVAKPYVLGFEDANFVRMDAPSSAATPLWPLVPPGKRGDAMRLGPVPGKRMAVTYRYDNKVYFGLLSDAGEVVQAASEVPGSGGMVGRPNLGQNGRDVSVVFADRSAAKAPIEMRWAHGPIGKPLGKAEVVELPPGGPGGHAIAPAVAGLSGGRWLLMWTEGKSGSRTLRAQTYDHRYRPVGAALRVSPATGSFGQGTVAVVGDEAVVVFLLASRRAYQVWGTVLQCQ